MGEITGSEVLEHWVVGGRGYGVDEGEEVEEEDEHSVECLHGVGGV